MKAMLIVTVVTAHLAYVDETLKSVIYMFHIPAFLFVSGYLTTYSKGGRHLARTIGCLALSILIWNLIICLIFQKEHFFTSPRLQRNLTNTVWCYYPTSKTGHSNVSQMWFVWTLIIMKTAVYWIRGKWKLLTAIAVTGIVYTIIMQHTQSRTLFYIDRTMTALPFYIAGYMARNAMPQTYTMSRRWQVWLVATALLCVALNLIFNKEHVDMFHWRTGISVVLYYVTAMSMTIVVIESLKKIKVSNYAVSKISTGTFLILATHVFAIYEIGDCLSWDQTGVIETLIIVAVCMPMIILSERYLPILIGKASAGKK